MLSFVLCVLSVWLNEGFATFVQYIGMEWAVPELEARDQFLLLDESAAMAFDSSPNAHPVIDLTTQSGNFDNVTNQQTHSHTDTQAQDTALLPLTSLLHPIPHFSLCCCAVCCTWQADYQKGASLLRMLEGVLGPAVWLRGINAYIQQYKYSNARSVDLFAHLTQAANDSGLAIDVADFMAPWTQVAGYPLVSCTTRSAGVNSTEWQCTQQRYYANPPPANPDTTTAWNIYLALAGTPIPLIHWPASQHTVTFTAPSNSGYVKLNANSTGYFRAMYDDWGWQQLSRALNASEFGGLSGDDRLGVVMDALVFARDERLSWATLLPLLQFLQYETSAEASTLARHFQPFIHAADSLLKVFYACVFIVLLSNWPVWTVAAPSLLNVYKLMAGKADGLAALYTTYLQQQFRLVALSLNTSRFDTIRDKSLYTVLADAIVRFDVGGRRQEFADQFARLRRGGNVSDVPADEVDLVLQCGVWSGVLGNASGAMFVFDEYYWPAVLNGGFERADATDALSYAQLLKAMSSSNSSAEIDLLITLFSTTGDRNPPLEHRVLMLQYLSQSDVARPQLNRYVGCCLPTLNATLGGEPVVGRVLWMLLASQWDGDQLALLNAALDENRAVVSQSTWDSVEAGRVIANENIEYAATVYPDISNYMSSMRWRNG